MEMSEDEIRLKKFLLEELHENVMFIKFEKKDKTIREMKCSLSDAVIPHEQKPNESKRKSNPEVIKVWDIDKGAWRSFRVDSVIGYRFDTNKILDLRVKNKLNEVING